MQQNEGTSFIYVKYATLSEYFTAARAVTGVQYPTDVGGDFFPLLDGKYWTVFIPFFPLCRLIFSHPHPICRDTIPQELSSRDSQGKEKLLLM
jgi:hypothetical protein